jgi:hypothetical protein
VPFSIPEESQYLNTNAAPLDYALSRVALLDPSHDYRVIFGGKIDKQKAAMLASYRGIRTLNAYVNPAPYRQFTEMYYHVPSGDNYFFVLGANFLICDICNSDAIRGYRHIEDAGPYAIYEAERALPHSYLRTSIDGYFKTTDGFKGETANINIGDGILFLENGSRLALPQRSDGGRGCNQIEKERTSTYDRFDTTCSSDSVLVLNEFFDNAWSAYVDGEPVQISEVNGNQLGVFLPAGAHFVEFEYSPNSLKVALFLMAIGISISCFYIFYFGRRRGVDES